MVTSDLLDFITVGAHKGMDETSDIDNLRRDSKTDVVILSKPVKDKVKDKGSNIWPSDRESNQLEKKP